MIIFEGKKPHSLVHSFDPRIRVVLASAFAIVVCLGDRIAVLGIAFGIALLLAAMARMLNTKTLRRLAELNSFMLLLAVFLPLSAPTVLHGLRMAAMIAIKANTVMIGFIALVGTLEPAYLGFALNRLRVPRKLTHVLLFMVRYVEVIHLEYHRLVNAMRLRAFRPGCNQHTFRTYGCLIGMLLVRSLDRAERIVAAMKCRGFLGTFHVLARFRVAPRDILFAALLASSIVMLACLEWI
ncbi:MAG: energy-coupling factor transporter transmembrane component T family protein [Armatimonadota bacterium]